MTLPQRGKEEPSRLSAKNRMFLSFVHDTLLAIPQPIACQLEEDQLDDEEVCINREKKEEKKKQGFTFNWKPTTHFLSNVISRIFTDPRGEVCISFKVKPRVFKRKPVCAASHRSPPTQGKHAIHAEINVTTEGEGWVFRDRSV